MTFNLNSGLYKPYQNRMTSYFTLLPRLITLRKLSNSFRIPSIENSSKINRIKQSLKNEYEEVLHKSGYKSNFKFQQEISAEKKNRRLRKILSGSIHHSAKQLRQTLLDYLFIY